MKNILILLIIFFIFFISCSNHAEQNNFENKLSFNNKMYEYSEDTTSSLIFLKLYKSESRVYGDSYTKTDHFVLDYYRNKYNLIFHGFDNNYNITDFGVKGNVSEIKGGLRIILASSSLDSAYFEIKFVNFKLFITKIFHLDHRRYENYFCTKDTLIDVSKSDTILYSSLFDGDFNCKTVVYDSVGYLNSLPR